MAFVNSVERHVQIVCLFPFMKFRRSKYVQSMIKFIIFFITLHGTNTFHVMACETNLDISVLHEITAKNVMEDSICE